MSEYCPRCGTQRVGGFRFCRSCQLDFDELGEASGAWPAPETSVGPASVPTAATDPAATMPPATAAAAGLNLAAVAVMIGGAVVAVAAFLPWISASAPFIGTITRSGMEGGDGFFAIGIGVALVLSGVQAFRGPVTRSASALVLVLALAGIGLAVLEFVTIQDRIEGIDEDYRALATVGLGIYAMAVGAGGAFMAGFALRSGTQAGLVCPHCGKRASADRKELCNHCGLPLKSWPSAPA